MTLSSPACFRFAATVILPLLMTPLPASGAPVRRTKPPATASAPVKADTSIIALPLYPIVPAGQRLCAARTSTGLGYSILRSAAGAKPGANDLVLVNYVGYLAATGAVFDQGMRAALSVDGVIAGFSEGLRMMAKSGVARLCIPAALGYGARATGPIPANADLVFQVELVDYRAAADLPGMTKSQAGEPLDQKVPTPQQ